MRTLRGRVEFRDLEGGNFQLVGDDGTRTTLVGARKDLKGQVGKHVEVEVEEDGGFGIAMTGAQARVVRVKG